MARKVMIVIVVIVVLIPVIVIMLLPCGYDIIRALHRLPLSKQTCPDYCKSKS